MTKALDVAEYFLSLQDDDAGDAITNLKLQKLLYYAQGFYLAIFGSPLFTEKIRAWEHGPVVREAWDAYKEHSSNKLPIPEGIDLSIFTEDEHTLLDEVYQTYGQYSAWKLRNMTHEEPPWKNNFSRGLNNLIPHKDLRDYFETLVENPDEVEDDETA